MRSNKKRGRVVMAIDDGQHQRAGAVRIGHFNIGAMIEQDRGAFGEASACGKEQRGKSAARESASARRPA